MSRAIQGLHFDADVEQAERNMPCVSSRMAGALVAAALSAGIVAGTLPNSAVADEASSTDLQTDETPVAESAGEGVLVSAAEASPVVAAPVAEAATTNMTMDEVQQELATSEALVAQT